MILSDVHSSEKIPIGISACLLGHEVRYDGGHKKDRYLVETLGRWVDYVPVCPEAESGLGIPRESMILLGDAESPRLITRNSGKDKTDQVLDWCKPKLEELEGKGLCGFIFKSGSPSSGMERVRIYNSKGGFSKTGVGIFARAFMEHFPHIPTEEEGRLHDPPLRENFIERIFALRRWRHFIDEDYSRGGLVNFHTHNKMLILSHSRDLYTELGRLVASQKSHSMENLVLNYGKILMKALRLKATPKKNANVLMHILGYFKKYLDAKEKQELLTVIEYLRLGYVPLIVPITLVQHYVSKYEQVYLKKQTYLSPHPIELQLRNHV